MEVQLLKDPNVYPDQKVLRNELGNVYQVYEKFVETITGPTYGLIPEWRYYNDGKAWLCKVSFKKKTVFWLSVWNSYFKISFYFAEKYTTGIAGLDIDKIIIDSLAGNKAFGRLIPLVIRIDNDEQIRNVLKLLKN